MRRHLASLCNIIPPHERPPTAESAAKADDVFSTPELLVTIPASGLSAKEKFAAMQVDRGWRDTVRGSKTLRQTLGLSLPMNPFYSSPFSEFDDDGDHRTTSDFPGGASFHSKLIIPPAPTFATKGLEILQMMIQISTSSRWNKVTVGSRVQSMTICNPPIFDLEVTKTCRVCRDGTPIMIRSESVLGFTVGEVLHQVDTARKHDTHCPNCITPRHVRFDAMVTLQYNDPEGKGYHKWIAKKYEREQRWLAEHDGTEPSESDYSNYEDRPVHDPWRNEGSISGDSSANDGNGDLVSEDGTKSSRGSESMYRDLGMAEWNKTEDRRWACGGPERRLLDLRLWGA